MRKIYSTLLLSIALFTSTGLMSQTFVDQSATGANDGSSWLNAYASLHEALDSYVADDELWVATGTYLPGESSAWSGTARTTFYIHQNVKLYGGFEGSETTLAERDPSANPTILSGDINGDDIMSEFLENRMDNVMNVVYVAEAIDNTTIIDGFEIIGGHADGDGSLAENLRGGGIWAYGSPRVKNCHFIDNFSLAYGGGFYARNAASAASIIEDCVFESNYAEIGGGGITLSTAGASQAVEMSNCQFLNNDSQGFGAGLYIFGSSADVSDCLFEENTAIVSGGGLFLSLLNEDACYISECTFNNNISSNGGACAIQGTGSATSSTIVFDVCDFTGNQAAIIADDNLNDGGAIFIEYLADGAQNNTVELADCLFENNSARVGGGINAIHFSGANNELYLSDCQYVDNPASDGGGIQVWELGATGVLTRIERCEFSGNTGGFFQAVAQINQSPDTDCEMEVINCLFHENGGAESNKSVLATSGVMSVRSCTFSDNESTSINLRDAGQLSIQNTILASLSNPSVVVDMPADAMLISNGGNLISDDSMNDWLNILDQSGTAPDLAVGTYVPTESSPAVDAGVILPDNPEEDLAGNDRVQGGCIDIGAYESSFDSGSGCISGLFETIDELTGLEIFPNPVSEVARLSIANDWTGAVQLSIVDILGQEVYQSAVQKTTEQVVVELDVRNLEKSSYYIIISNMESIAIQSFVKL